MFTDRSRLYAGSREVVADQAGCDDFLVFGARRTVAGRDRLRLGRLAGGLDLSMGLRLWLANAQCPKRRAEEEGKQKDSSQPPAIFLGALPC
jgi:hypothetical protein